VIARGEWRWLGAAGHFIAADSCRWHLCTVVGDYMVSSVGEYVPNGRGRGDGFEQIGCDRLYEVMVFKCAPCREPGCHCGGEPRVTDLSEVDYTPANTRAEAAANHEAKCLEWASK
jgi:hypothetical protein